jgi:hypothetical protein
MTGGQHGLIKHISGMSLSADPKELTLVGLIVDDSSSIDSAGNTKAVVDGHNSFLEQIRQAPGNVRYKRMFLNAVEQGGFKDPKEVELLEPFVNYHPTGNTPLFLSTVSALEEIEREAKELRSQGFTVRVVVLVFTDGRDNQSAGTTAANVKALVEPMLASGECIVGGCAVNDRRTNFWEVFASMGIPKQWIMILEGGGQISEAMTTMGHTTSFSTGGAGDFLHTSRTGFQKPSDKK